MAHDDTGSRKLAAIMFTDIKGFSKKMGEDEVAAMQVLRTHDAMMKAVVEKHGGVVIKSIGDSFMVDFSSAVNAVKCAIEAQENFWSFNKGKSEFEKIEIRVGIHLGDVITLGNDVYGDGVNIAARIEAITEPTRICISEDVYKQVRNKMQIKVYKMGFIELKNIAYPVEVFELLFESIPELSQPSEGAQNRLSQKKAESISKQEEEEAKVVEVARKKADEEKKKEEDEKQRQANEIFERAEQHFKAGEINEADEALKEVFRIAPMHYGAQMMVLQVEEELARREDEARRQRVKDEKKRKEEERQAKVQACLERAIQFVEQDQFPEALAAVKDVYLIDPKNAEAKQLEEQIRQAEQAQQELDRLQALESEQQAQELEQRQRREAEAMLAQAKAEAMEGRQVLLAEAEKPDLKLYLRIAAGVVIVIAAAILILQPEFLFPSPPRIAVLRFDNAQLRGEENYSGAAVATLLGEGLARSPDLIVLAPSTATKTDLADLRDNLGLQYAVLGTFRNTDLGISVAARLVEVSTNETLWQTSVDGNLLELPQIATRLTEAILTQLQVGSADLPSPRRPSPSAEAYDYYLRGIHLVQQPNVAAIEQGIAYLQIALQYDSTFADALAGFGRGLLERFKRTGERDQSLVNQAFDLGRAAVGFNSSLPLAYDLLAESYWYNRRFTNVREMATKSLSLRPAGTQPYRMLALVDIIDGDFESAAKNIAHVAPIDPGHPGTHFVTGLLHHYQREYQAAVRSYDQAAKLGMEDSLLSMRFKFNALISADMEERVYTACERYLAASDPRTKIVLNYWIGRAYQLEGKLDPSLNALDEGIAIADSLLGVDPDNLVSHTYLALLLSRRGNFEAAQKQMDRAESLAPDSPNVLYMKARMAALQQNKVITLQFLERAIAAEYTIEQILDVDLLSVAGEAEFTSTVARKTR
jgi:class 3 adenylate cyclase/tetratricopeptide (TPR) repeat protein